MVKTMQSAGIEKGDLAQRSQQLLQGLARRQTTSHEPSWLMTFVDLISLLLAFFVLLFSMANPHLNQFKKAAASISYSLTGDVRVIADQLQPPEESSLAAEYRPRGLDLSYLQRLMAAKLAQSTALASSQLYRQGEKLILSMPNKLLFDVGSEQLSQRGRQAVFELSVALNSLDNSIAVLGHSDPTPIIESPTYANNWDLSLARALSVAAALCSAGFNKPLTVRGAADGFFEDYLLTEDLATRTAFARRVDIIFDARGDK